MSPVPRRASSQRKHSTRRRRARQETLRRALAALLPYVREIGDIVNDEDFPGQHTLPVIALQAAVSRLARRMQAA